MRFRRTNVAEPGASALLTAVEADPKLLRKMAIERAEQKARALYHEIAAEVGADEAVRIFGNWRHPSKGEIAAFRKHMALWLYEDAGRPPRGTFAKKLAAYPSSYWFGSGYSYEAILQALKRYDQALKRSAKPKKRMASKR